MLLFRFISIFFLIFVLSNCTDSQDSPLDAVGVCRLIAAIDLSKITSSEMADQTFDQFALELQDANVRSDIKEVFNLANWG